MPDASNVPGSALIEVSDLSSPLTSNFANFYVRGFVGTAYEVLSGGIVVRGTATERALFRALGSDLGKSGIANSLANPVSRFGITMVCYWRLMTIGKTRPSRKKFHRSVWHLATKMTPRCY